MDAGQLLADGLDEQRRHHRGVHAAGEGQQDLLVPHLPADELHLIGDEVLHIPVGLSAADPKDEVGKSGLPLLRIGGPGGVSPVIGQQDRNRGIVDLFGDVDLHAVHHAVGAAVENDALHVGERGQLLRRDVMGMDLTVHAKGTDLPGQSRVLLTAQIQNDDHVLLHRSPSYVRFWSYPTIPAHGPKEIWSNSAVIPPGVPVPDPPGGPPVGPGRS